MDFPKVTEEVASIYEIITVTYTGANQKRWKWEGVTEEKWRGEGRLSFTGVRALLDTQYYFTT